MVKGLDVQCGSCRKRFWVEMQLKFGARTTSTSPDLLECFLEDSLFYFNCPHCEEQLRIGAKFQRLGAPLIAQVTENQSYIG